MSAVVRDHTFALIAPVFWSIAGVTVRFMDSATAWQINFYRSGTLACFVIVVLLIRYRGGIVSVFANAGSTAVWAGLFVGGAMVCNIVALKHTTVANAVLLMASAPIFAAVIGRFVLGERTSLRTWIAIGLVLIGIAVMVGDSVSSGGLLGDLVALLGIAFFGAYAITLRRGRAVDMTPAVAYAGLFSGAVGGVVAVAAGTGLAPPPGDIALCVMLGIVQLGIGSVLFALAANSVAAVDLTLYALGEPLLAPLWAWLLVDEAPSAQALAGGAIILFALMLHISGSLQRAPATAQDSP